MTYQRERPRPLYKSSSHERSEALAVAQLHRDIYCICDHANVMAITQGPGDVGGSSAGGESHSLVLLDQFSRRQSDTALLCCTMLLTVLKKRVIAKRLVEQRLDQSSSARRSPYQALDLQLC